MNNGIAHIIPLRIRTANNYPYRYSNELAKKIKLKKKAHVKYKKRMTLGNDLAFNKLKSEYKKLRSECYQKCLNRVENDLMNDSKEFWTFLKNKRRSDVDIPSMMTWNGVYAFKGTVCLILRKYL